MKNRRAPKVIPKYVVVVQERKADSLREHFQYFRTQQEAKAWSKNHPGKKLLFKINYDFIGYLE